METQVRTLQGPRDVKSVLKDSVRAAARKKNRAVVEVAVGLSKRALLETLLPALRSQDQPVLVSLISEPQMLEADTLYEVGRFLRCWDQLSTQNLIVLLQGRIPSAFETKFQIQAKLEAKSLREWILGDHDATFKVPPLPWRSFIRKINNENFVLLEALSFGAAEPVESVLQNFLEQKSRVVCKFPKKWQG